MEPKEAQRDNADDNFRRGILLNKMKKKFKKNKMKQKKIESITNALKSNDQWVE